MYITSKRNLYALTVIAYTSHFLFLPFPGSWQPLIYFLSLWICLFWKFPINRILQYVVFCDWLLLLSITFSRFIYLMAWISTLFLFIIHCAAVSHFIYLFISWRTFRLFPYLTIMNTAIRLLCIMLLWAFMYTFFVWTCIFLIYNLLSDWFPYNTQCSSQQVHSWMPITHFPLSPQPPINPQFVLSS